MLGSAMSLFSLIMPRTSSTLLFRARHITAATTVVDLDLPYENHCVDILLCFDLITWAQ